MEDTESQSLKEIQWLKQALESETIRVQSIRFYLCSSTSFCFREAESAIVASFSEGEHGSAAFSSLVSELSRHATVRSILAAVEFHGVVWKSELVRVVGAFLADCCNMKQLRFHRNRFDVECLSAVGEILRSSGVIKEVIFSESDIGSVGTELMASAIQKNEILEEFQIWEDSIGRKGAQKLSMMIEANSTLKSLTIFDLSSSSSTPITISSVLGRNREMEVHIWEMEANKTCKSAEFIVKSGALRLYKLDELGSCMVISSLAYNTTVSLLDLTGIPLTTRWAKQFRLILEQNRRLTKVILSRTRLKNNGIKYVAAALFQNKNLESLSLDGNWFGGNGVSFLLCPLSKFSILQHQANTTLKSITFGGRKTRIRRDGLSAIIRLMETNESLEKLRIHDDRSLIPEDFVKIFERLKTNASLRCLSLQGCEGIRGNFVLEKIMEMLQVNPWMNKIDLARTPLHDLGLAEEIYQKLNQIERIEPETEADFFKDLPLVEPRNLRVFVCGNEFAGKTTLCSTMTKSFLASNSTNGNLVRTLMKPVERAAARTSGMKTKIIKHGDLKISLWNLSDKHECFALHDLMFPGHGSSSLFLVTSSLFQNPEIFLNFDPNDLVKMMLKLELCYEQVRSDPNSPLLVPLILEEGRSKPQKWQLSTSNSIYIGRHLECDDSNHASLSHGFFPRLQVHLHHRIMAEDNHYNATYRLERYLMEMNINGIDIRVELGGKMEHHIDVIACSSKNITRTLGLIQELIIPAIHSLTHGVVLVESIIRPECVRNLIPPRYRRRQHVSLQQLKQALLAAPAECMYDYQHAWDPVSDSGTPILRGGFDFARDLLSDDDFRQVLLRRCDDLHSLAVELDVPPERSASDGTGNLRVEGDKIDPSLAGIANGVEQVLQRLNIVEQEMRDLKQEIQGLRYYEHRLLVELHRKVDYLVNYNVDVEERKLPNMFFFVRTENYARRLVSDLISGMTALRLHMLCEFRNEMHTVDDQIGCEITLVDNHAVECLAPYAKKFMKLATIALRIGAHLAGGLGEMIPDLSQQVCYLAGSSTIHGAAGAAAAGALGIAAAGKTRGITSRSLDRRSNIQQDQQPAHQWVADLLKERNCFSGKDIAEKFGLWRVRYHDNGHLAWICSWHASIKAHELTLMPI